MSGPLYGIRDRVSTESFSSRSYNARDSGSDRDRDYLTDETTPTPDLSAPDGAFPPDMSPDFLAWLEDDSRQSNIMYEPMLPADEPVTKPTFTCTRRGCPKNGTVYKCRSAWERHEGTHTKRYTCPHEHCNRHREGEGFSRLDNLKVHLKSKMHRSCCKRKISNIHAKVKGAAAKLSTEELFAELKERMEGGSVH